MAGRTLVVVCDWRDRGPPMARLTVAERAYAATLPAWRGREWARGRLTAKAALRWSGVAGRPEILSDPCGAPHVTGRLACAPVTLCVAHTATVMACAVHLDRAAGPCGVDVERIHDDNELLLRRIAAPGDLDALGCLPRRWRATFLVSAKEAALKAYRGRSLRLRDYRLVRSGPGELRMHLAGTRLPELQLRYTIVRDLVVTCCVPPLSSLRWCHAAVADLLAACLPDPTAAHSDGSGLWAGTRVSARRPGPSTTDTRSAPRQPDRQHTDQLGARTPGATARSRTGIE